MTNPETKVVIQPFGRDSVYGAPSTIKPVIPVEAAPAPVVAPAPIAAPAPPTKPMRVAAPAPRIEPAAAPVVAPIILVRTTDLANKQWIENLNHIRNDVRLQSNHNRNATATAAVTVSVFSSGYLIWLLRGGLLLTSLLSTLPAWQTLDPLPILASAKRRSTGEEEKLDSVERLFAEGSGVDGASPEAMPITARGDRNESGTVAPIALGADGRLNPQSR